MLGVIKGINNRNNFLTRRNYRKFLVIMKERNLIAVPVPVKDIVEEVPELGNMHIYGTAIEFSYFLKETDI